MKVRPLVLLTLAAAMTASPGSAGVTEPPPVGREMAGRDTGLICIWGIYASMLEVGRQCEVSRNAAVEAELARSVSLLEDYSRRRSPEGAAHMAAYRARQIDGERRLCHADPIRMYEEFSRVDPALIRRETEGLLAASPPVEWGTCL
jgi:hypothetical protein